MSTDDHAEHGHDSEFSDAQLRVRALETILTEKGYVDPAVLDGIIEHYETKTGPHIGARVIARAWVDPQFKAALLEDATKAIASLGVARRRSSDRSREHAGAAQHGRVHALLVLPVGRARPAAGLVQVDALSLARRHGPARRARRLRRELPPEPRFACGTPPPRRASSCCRSAPQAPTAGARSGSQRSSRAIA